MPGSEQSVSDGQRLYQTYCSALARARDNHRWRGKSPIAWEFLTPAEREAWEWGYRFVTTGERPPP